MTDVTANSTSVNCLSWLYDPNQKLDGNFCATTQPSSEELFPQIEDQNSQTVLPLTPTKDYQTINSLDIRRTSYNLLGAAATISVRAFSDWCLANHYFRLNIPLSGLKLFLNFANKSIDIDSDRNQLQLLERNNFPSLNPTQIGYTHNYLWLDGSAAGFSISSELSGFTADALLKPNSTNAVPGRLAVGGLFFQTITLTSAIASAYYKLNYEYSLPENKRDYITIARAQNSLASAISPFFTSIFRLLVIYTKRNDLTWNEIFKFARGFGMPDQFKDLMYNQTIGKILACLAIVTSTLFTLHEYLPKIQQARESGRDDELTYYSLGMSSLLLRNIGMGLMNLNHALASRVAAGFLLSGIGLAITQIEFNENGGLHGNSPAFILESEKASKFLNAINASRLSWGTPILELKTSADNNFMDNFGFHSEVAKTVDLFSYFQRFLIILGLDLNQHNDSVLEKPSFQVITQASDVYSLFLKNQTSDGALSQGEKLALLKRILVETQLSDNPHSELMSPQSLDSMTILNQAMSAPDPVTLSGSRYVFVEYDYTPTDTFLKKNSLAQATYLVLLQIVGVLTEESFGTEIWNSPGMQRIRARLSDPDATNIRYQLLNFDARSDSLLGLYLSTLDIKDKEDVLANLNNLPQNFNLAGINDYLASMETEIQNIDPDLSEEELKKLWEDLVFSHPGSSQLFEEDGLKKMLEALE